MLKVYLRIIFNKTKTQFQNYFQVPNFITINLKIFSLIN